MKPLHYTLVADGGSDRILIQLINWLLVDKSARFPDLAWRASFAEFTTNPKNGLAARVAAAMKYYGGDLLFIHRDAEGESWDRRDAEIRQALASQRVPHVPIIPIRMSEAWFLIDEQAIRTAADNPNGKQRLNLPSLARLEKEKDPKEVLFAALRTASGLTGRRLNGFHVDSARHRVAELIDDFSPLRQLSAFNEFEKALDQALTDLFS